MQRFTRRRWKIRKEEDGEKEKKKMENKKRRRWRIRKEEDGE